MSSIELSSCCSCYVFNQQFTYSLFSFMWPASMQIYWNKSFNSHRTGLGHNYMAALSLFWDTNMAAMTSCENTQFLPHEMSEMFRHFVFTTKTTQPCPQVFLVNHSIIWQFCCTIDVNSSHIAKFL